jgi:hypothetical protein
MIITKETVDQSQSDHQIQLEQLKALLESLQIAYENFQMAHYAHISGAFDHPELSGEHWRSRTLEMHIAAAIKFLSLAIDGTENLSISTISGDLSSTRLEQLWQCVFWNSYCYCNASYLENVIEELRKAIGERDGTFYNANSVSRFLCAKVTALRNSWRQEGVPEALLEEVVTQIRQLSSGPIQPLAVTETWSRGLAALRVSIEEYESLVERYSQCVSFIVSSLALN